MTRHLEIQVEMGVAVALPVRDRRAEVQAGLEVAVAPLARDPQEEGQVDLGVAVAPLDPLVPDLPAVTPTILTTHGAPIRMANWRGQINRLGQPSLDFGLTTVQGSPWTESFTTTTTQGRTTPSEKQRRGTPP